MARQSKLGSRVADELGFEDSLRLTRTHVKEPSPYPEGTWDIVNRGFSTKIGKDRDGNEQLVVNLRYEGFKPGPDVDQDLVEQGGFEGKTIFVPRYISLPASVAARDGTLASFIRFVEMHGEVTVGDDDDVEAMARMLKDEHVGCSIADRPYDDRNGDHHVDSKATGFHRLEA